MALVANATKISIHSSKLPTGYTDPGGTNLASAQPKYENLVLSIAKATVQNATKSTTFDNIRTDVTIGIEKQIADKLGLEMDDTANTITYNIDWKDINDNQNITDEFYTDTAAAYKALVDVYVVVS